MFYHALTGNDGTTPVKDLLWTNPSPNTALQSGVLVQKDFSKYSKIYVEGKKSVTESDNIFALIEKSEVNAGALALYKGGEYLSYRIINFKNNMISVGNGVAGSSENQNYCIATKIYGIE